MHSSLVILLALVLQVAALSPFYRSNSARSNGGIFTPNIINGVEAKKSVNYMGLLNYDGDYMCGCVLIDDRHVLTAARCLEESLDPKDYEVILGKRHDNKIDPTEQTYQVIAVAAHKDYDFFQYSQADNIAILRLATPVQFTPNIGVATLSADIQNLYEGVEATVSGWGVYKRGDFTHNIPDKYKHVLLSAKMTVLTSAECRTETGLDSDFTDWQLCAQSTHSMTTCMGDYGGPLVVKSSDGSAVLIGLVSFQQDDCALNKPTVFTRVTAYLSWIAQTKQKFDKH